MRSGILIVAEQGAPRQGERTIRGRLLEINLKNNSCEVHPEGQRPVDCAYEESIEDDLIAALKKDIEMAGQFIELDRPRDHFRITRIERFRVVEEGDGGLSD